MYWKPRSSKNLMGFASTTPALCTFKPGCNANELMAIEGVGGGNEAELNNTSNLGQFSHQKDHHINTFRRWLTVTDGTWPETCQLTSARSTAPRSELQETTASLRHCQTCNENQQSTLSYLFLPRLKGRERTVGTTAHH